MAESFMKALRWYFLTLCLIGGTTAMIVSQEANSPRPIILAVVSYGAAYVMAAFWKDFRGKLLFASLFVFLLISFSVPFIQMGLFILFGFDTSDPTEYSQHGIWAIITGLVGVPLMTLVFRKLD